MSEMELTEAQRQALASLMLDKEVDILRMHFNVNGVQGEVALKIRYLVWPKGVTMTTQIIYVGTDGKLTYEGRVPFALRGSTNTAFTG